MFANSTAGKFRRAFTCSLRHPLLFLAEELLVVVDIFHDYIHSKCMLQKAAKPVAFVPAPSFSNSFGESSFCSVLNNRGS